jgi:hypothetical protein
MQLEQLTRCLFLFPASLAVKRDPKARTVCRRGEKEREMRKGYEITVTEREMRRG